VRLLLFIPSYNDAASAHALAKRFLGEGGVERAMIVDDSDDPSSAAYAESIRNSGVEAVRRRGGKWSAWRLALEASMGFDGLVEVDSDVAVRSPALITAALAGWDAVTAYQDVVVPDEADPLSRRLGEVYRDAHMRLRAAGKFNMGGRLMALSARLVKALLDMGFFLEPVHGDDHVICLAAAALGLMCRSVDCGMEMKAPARLGEWIRYRSRHRGVIGWSEGYVASKTGLGEETLRASRTDYGETVAAFLSSLLNPRGRTASPSSPSSASAASSPSRTGRGGRCSRPPRRPPGGGPTEKEYKPFNIKRGKGCIPRAPGGNDDRCLNARSVERRPTSSSRASPAE